MPIYELHIPERDARKYRYLLSEFCELESPKRETVSMEQLLHLTLLNVALQITRRDADEALAKCNEETEA